ncbi:MULTISPECIES: hypothetical protein [Chryseobacterium]|uniref:Uncharacterized protein n=1 Tax=Chryseobacterium rhizosphaerae TaxID=395937 RepID=A0AAE3YEC3_9FLAO|nr:MULTISPECIES: hypothetical protein [Chryseobacterium]MDR6528855.1 hypothetical protein [Chryseobacterium rhizosphaerae]SMC96412.1 hypothetical protein SAMN02787074_4076 [Chryseobacterium sp. YR221]
MKKNYLLLLPFTVGLLQAQNSKLYYSGKFLTSKNKTQSFLKVYNKNNGTYELTDEEGFAIIAAKPYDTLVWNQGESTHVISSYEVRELKAILEGQTEKKSVENTYSKAYDSMVSKEAEDEFSIEKAKTFLSKKSNNNFYNIRRLRQKSDSLYTLKGLNQRTVVLNGSFTSSLDIKSRNAVPRIQDKYVQGRSENGSLIWNGPETNEMFSFGPDISTLGFSGLAYEYDQNGKLIPWANGLPHAKKYNNGLFKTTVGYNNQLNISAFIKEGNNEKIRLSFNLGQQKNQMYFIDQFDIANTFKAKLNTIFGGYAVNLAFNYEEDKATNTNRIGLFNRAYQNSLLAPVSFSNEQQVVLNNGSQRSYSIYADNPSFLFEQDSKYRYQSLQRQFSLNIAKTWGDFRLNLSQSYENNSIQNRDHYKPSTYGFNNGLLNERMQNNSLYYSNVLGTYILGYDDFKNTFNLNFILNDRKSDVYNSLTDRNSLYQRTSQDYIFNYNMDIRDYDFDAGFNLGNSFYISNTSIKNNYWLPKANFYLKFSEIFNWINYSFKLFGSYTQLSSEPEITRSYASYATTLLKAENYNQYFPAQEAERFKDLSNINTREWKLGGKLNFSYNISIEGEYFNKKTIDDVFPVFENNQLKLKNMADHTYSGYELNFAFDRLRLGYDVYMMHKVSFFKYKDVVNRIAPGYQNMAVSGFKDIYKTLTEGQVLGVVMGSYFERNAAGQLIIDEYGFPKKAAGMKIIADSTPDFVMKFSHSFFYKRLSLDINWEWKKGGQLWNGTQAVLDYYGRSYDSGDERNIKKYVFQGVQANGNSNQIPVDFYDPGRNVQENRWTRYGYLGVAENYIQNADYIRISNISLSSSFPINYGKQNVKLTFYVNNLMLWQANKGVDPNQNFYDMDNGRGLDFFNLPSFKTFGCIVSLKF